MQHEALTAQNRYTALIVEPAPALARVLGSMVERFGFKVIAARTAEDAVEIADETRIDLLMTEFRLTEVTGPKLANFVAARHPEAQIVALCDAPPPGLGHMPRATTILAKPFTEDELANVLGVMTRTH